MSRSWSRATPSVRVVFKELPILAKGSEEASRVALAARIQGKYWEVHKRACFEIERARSNEASALESRREARPRHGEAQSGHGLARSHGRDQAKSEELAKKMGINGTPHFLVGDRADPRGPGRSYRAQLENHVDGAPQVRLRLLLISYAGSCGRVSAHLRPIAALSYRPAQRQHPAALPFRPMGKADSMGVRPPWPARPRSLRRRKDRSWPSRFTSSTDPTSICWDCASPPYTAGHARRRAPQGRGARQGACG